MPPVRPRPAVPLVLVALVLAVVPAGAGPVPATIQGGGSATPSGPATVEFDDQSTDGAAVTVATANLSAGGFVAVYAGSGRFLGVSRYLSPGVHENVTVAVTRSDWVAGSDPATDGTRTATPVAVAHRDTDGDRTFDFVGSNGSTDAPYVADGVVLDPANVTVVPTDAEGTPTPTASAAARVLPGSAAAGGFAGAGRLASQEPVA